MRTRCNFEVISAVGGAFHISRSVPDAGIELAVQAALKPLEDKIAARDAAIAELKSAASPRGETRRPAEAPLAKAALALPNAGNNDAKIPVDQLDRAIGHMPLMQRMDVKHRLAKAGLID